MCRAGRVRSAASRAQAGGGVCAGQVRKDPGSSSDRITSLSERIRSRFHRSTPNMATIETGDEFGDCGQTKGVDHQRCSAGASLRARRRPIGPFPRHRERAEIRIAQAQRLDARDTSDLQNIESPATQGMERVDDFSRSQRLVGPECSSTGVCPRTQTVWQCQENT